jgi:phospho-N-acetylmuramoyl-pentapeptide-transferase
MNADAMNGESIVQGILLAFAVVVVIMPAFIRFLRRLGMGKRIRLEGPETHYVKEGTPTMGGLLIVAVVLAIGLLVELAGGDFVDSSTFAPMATLALVGLLGTADDFLNARTGDGISAVQKLLWQSVVAGVAAWQIQDTYEITALFVPFFGALSIPPWLYILIAAFAIVASSNAVNITDGLDGLAGGTLIFAFIGYMVIAAVAFEPSAASGQPADPADLPLLCALIIGALLAFLWFNVHPAQVFMGDSGALALGATLAVIALITGQVLLLPLIGLIFVLETMADILQIASVKLRGKRLFLMAPLHHHFELKGWDEEKITLRFWIVGALSALVGVAFFLATRGLLS